MAEYDDVRTDAETRPLLSRTSTAYESEAAPDHNNQDAKPSVSALRGFAIGISMFVLLFLMTSNVSLMTTIQSPIAEELNASSEVTWFNSAYLIAVTSIMPISGKLCQIFTAEVYLLASIVIQSGGHLLISQARSTQAFLIGRAVCGIGSAAVTPVTFILVTKLVSPKRRGLMFGCVNTGYTTGLACGAIIAGALEPVVGWRTVFWMQIPVAMLFATIAFLMIPREDSNSDDDETIVSKLARIDYLGVITLIITLVLLLGTLSAPKIDYRAFALAAGMLVIFVVVESKWAKEPIVPPSVLRSRANLLSGIATVGIMTARWGILFYTPVYAIAVRGWHQSAAGALLVPTNFGFATGGLLAGWLHIRRTGSFYTPTLICFAIFSVVQFLVSRLVTPDSYLGLFILALFLNGFVVGALLNYSLAHLLHLTPPSQHVIVIPFNATFRSFSGSFGAAIAGGYFLRTLRGSLHRGFKAIGKSHNGELVRKLIGSPLLVQKLEGDERIVAIDAYASALGMTFLAGVGLAILMSAVQAGVGRTAPDDADAKEEPSQNDISRVVSQE